MPENLETLPEKRPPSKEVYLLTREIMLDIAFSTCSVDYPESLTELSSTVWQVLLNLSWVVSSGDRGGQKYLWVQKRVGLRKGCSAYLWR